MARFTFVGDLSLPRDLDRFYRGWDKNGRTFATVNFGIKAGTSIVNVELFGMKTDEVYYTSNDNERISVDWDKRNDEDILKDCRYYDKHLCRLTEDKEFIAAYDLVEELSKVLPSYEGKVKVTGNVELQPYGKDGNNRVFTKYNIKNIYKATDADKVGLYTDCDIFYNKDGVDTDSYKTDKKIYLSAYMKQYISDGSPSSKYIDNNGIRGEGQKGQTVYIPMNFVLNLDKIDMENPLHKKRADYLIGELAKAKSNKKIYEQEWHCSVVSGAEEVEFDETQLTEDQKVQIEVGLATLDDFKPKGNIYGSRVEEVRLLKPNLTGRFTDGIIECVPEVFEELESATMRYIEVESFADLIKETEETEEKKKEENYAAVDAIEDLFA